MAGLKMLFFCLLLSIWASFSNADMSCKVLRGSCPSFLDAPDKIFCCQSLENGNTQYCCNQAEFLEMAGTVVPIVLGVIVVIAIFICCICCACCSCCPCYRKRERGTVYVVPGPSNVQVIQNPPAMPNYGNNPYPQQAYPAMPQSPPSYSTEAYTKQAPYNPNYPNL